MAVNGENDNDGTKLLSTWEITMIGMLPGTLRPNIRHIQAHYWEIADGTLYFRVETISGIETNWVFAAGQWIAMHKIETNSHEM